MDKAEALEARLNALKDQMSLKEEYLAVELAVGMLAGTADVEKVFAFMGAFVELQTCAVDADLAMAARGKELSGLAAKLMYLRKHSSGGEDAVG